MVFQEWGEAPIVSQVHLAPPCLVDTQDKSLHRPPHHPSSEVNSMNLRRGQVCGVYPDDPFAVVTLLHDFPSEVVI